MASGRSGHSAWQRAVCGPARTVWLGWAVGFTVIAAGVVALAPYALGHLSDVRVGLVGNGGATGPATAALSSSPDTGRDEAALTAIPAGRTGLAFLNLDDPLERAVSALGPPDARVPDMNAAFAYTWDLAPGVELVVTADDHGILGLAARVPADGPVRIAAHAGVVIGESTPADIVRLWGQDHEVARHPGEDFVLRYIECVGAYPVVVKFEQGNDPAEVRWDEPVTGVFLAYADAEPGTAGCPVA
ncbi:MAG TPA: hypothetical protein VM324_01405 [Egibacteraceae bacterium]|nr:hypothetical protein [Egibacteraceae bacterium]